MIEVDRNHGSKVTFHNLLFILAHKKIDDLSKSLTLEDLLKRKEMDRSILEEAALQVLGAVVNDFVKFACWRRKSGSVYYRSK